MKIQLNFMTVLSLGVLSLGLSQCGPIDNVEQMAETTRDLKQTAEDLQKELDANLLLAKEVAGKTKREQCLAEMRNSLSFETMVMHASCYFMSFNFQVWTGLGEDTPERREDLFAQAVEEFTFTLPDSMVTRWFEPVRSFKMKFHPLSLTFEFFKNSSGHLNPQLLENLGVKAMNREVGLGDTHQGVGCHLTGKPHRQDQILLLSL